jgi:hypothetical protein
MHTYIHTYIHPHPYIHTHTHSILNYLELVHSFYRNYMSTGSAYRLPLSVATVVDFLHLISRTVKVDCTVLIPVEENIHQVSEIGICFVCYAMLAMLCLLCYACYAMLCLLCYAMLAMLAMLCLLCYAMLAMLCLLCYAMLNK